jgi:cyclic-di-GMP phosphodiesterase TipF (flagellum assembly factor)
VQGLVYILIVLACLGIGGAAYFGLTFTPIEAFVTAVAFGALAVTLMERKLRQRAEKRIEGAIEDLSRLLSADAQAGATLSQRVNAIADENNAKKIETLEADLSVLTTVVRELAEAVAETEPPAVVPVTATLAEPTLRPQEPEQEDDAFPEPVIPPELLRQALAENRLIYHILPIVTLPRRVVLGYDLVPRLMLEDGELADAPDFMPRSTSPDLIQQIETSALDEAVVIARRAKTGGKPVVIGVPISRPSLNATALEPVLATLEANLAIGQFLVFLVAGTEYTAMSPSERNALAQIAKRGVGFSLTASPNLRLDFSELQGLGFRSVRVDAARFIARPQTYTDFHTSDVTEYARRYGIELIASGVTSEQQVLTVFEDGITLAQGPLIGSAGPVRPDLLVDRSLAAAAQRAGA